MVFYFFSFSCPTKMKSFGMRAHFHLMMRNEIGLILAADLCFFYIKKKLAQTYEIFTLVCEVVQRAHFTAILKMDFA